ncbi:MAG: DUF4215 domain-containing protein [bacterium]
MRITLLFVSMALLSTPACSGMLQFPDFTGGACGNGVLDLGETCDDGTNDGSYGGCMGGCGALGPYCGDGTVDSMHGEECDDGTNDGSYGSCSSDCSAHASYCGDGDVDPSNGEECDDGVNDGSYGGCSSDCSAFAPYCGDGDVDTSDGEECDDGNNTDGDGCSANCENESNPVCGDGNVDAGEECDDGNTTSGDGCSADCLSDETCGNGITDTAVGEACDDGNTTAGDGCGPTCLLESCGNGVQDPGEVCDDGNNTDGDGCSANCTSDETCGNGITDTAVSETCDDGAANSNAPNAACRTNCQQRRCGDAVVDNLSGEVCDDGANNGSYGGCMPGCTTLGPRCGDGTLHAGSGETCDDGNNTTGDGCSATCAQEGCAEATDVSAASFPHTQSGTFGLNPAAGGSCEPNPTNAVYFTYTPSSTGSYQIDLVNNSATDPWSRVAVFQTTACNPYGAELACDDAMAAAISTTVQLTAGQGYLILFHTDGEPYTMVNPEITITQLPDPGEACSLAVDVSSETFPYQLIGDYDAELDPGGSCDTTPNNMVFFTYTPSTTGAYQLDLVNSTTTNAYSRVAVFQTTACSPYGAQLTCNSSTSPSVSTTVPLTAGQSYLILFYTDGDSFTMVNPEITITPITVGPGDACSQAIDVSGSTFPHQEIGTFGLEIGPGGSCDTTPNNMVFFSYTPSATGWYQLDLVNNTATAASSRVAVFETTACSPYGAQAACNSSTSPSVSTTAQLTAGQSYLILFYTNGDTLTMVDPSITITPAAPPGPGEVCSQAIDVSGSTFPHQEIGTFGQEVNPGGSCDTAPNNMVFFTYTPSTTGAYQLDLGNNTTTFAYSRVAVFETTACNPYGAEIECSTANSTIISTTVQLTAGQSYLIAFYTDGESYTMVDPEITIGPGSPPPPGESCVAPADAASPNYYPGGGGEDCWSWTANAGNTVNNHTFTCDAGVGGDVVVEYTTGATQTILNFDATIANFDASGYIGLEITGAPCASGASLYCASTTGFVTDTGSVTVSPNTTYYIWVADGFASHYLPDIDLCLW